MTITHNSNSTLSSPPEYFLLDQLKKANIPYQAGTEPDGVFFCTFKMPIRVDHSVYKKLKNELQRLHGDDFLLKRRFWDFLRTHSSIIEVKYPYGWFLYDA